MKIAIPLANGKLSMHFGHCEEFALIDVDENTKFIKGKTILTAPPHEPGLLPAWLADNGANVIVAGGMGSRAQGLFAEKNIKVVIGVREGTPEDIVSAYLNNMLSAGDNICDH
jgi:predicted Fe-Mo cluster-binding NifX family protein